MAEATNSVEVLIPKATFSLEEASQWLANHKLKFRPLDLDITNDYYRFVQPCRTSYKTKILDNGIKVIVEMRIPPPN